MISFLPYNSFLGMKGTDPKIRLFSTALNQKIYFLRNKRIEGRSLEK